MLLSIVYYSNYMRLTRFIHFHEKLDWTKPLYKSTWKCLMKTVKPSMTLSHIHIHCGYFFSPLCIFFCFLTEYVMVPGYRDVFEHQKHCNLSLAFFVVFVRCIVDPVFN